MLDGFPQWWLELLWEKTQFACRQVLLPCVSMWVNLTDDWTFVETAAKILRILEGILGSIKDWFWSKTSLLYLESLFTCLILFFSCISYKILFIKKVIRSIHKIKINRIKYFDILLHGISFWKHCCMVFLLHFAVSLAACLITQKCTNVNLKRKGPEDYFAPSPMCPIFSSSSTIFCAQDNHFWYCCC